MARTVAVILNASAGSGAGDDFETTIRDGFQRAGVSVDLTVASSPEQLHAGIEQALAAKHSAIVAGGGDGTISTVAAALAGTGVPLGVLPLGTLNHFAKDLELPLELIDAIDVVVAGYTTDVDVGEVNGRVFLNNSSLGLYPTIVRLREQRAWRGLGKWAAALRASLMELARFERFVVDVEVDGAHTQHRTPLLVIGNNRYRMAGLDAATRDSLKNGELAVYVVKASTRLQLVRLAWRIFRGRAFGTADLHVMHVLDAKISTRSMRHDVALDGEVERLDSPLEYRVRPGVLKVFTKEVGD